MKTLGLGFALFFPGIARRFAELILVVLVMNSTMMRAKSSWLVREIKPH